MEFGRRPVAEALGCILAHATVSAPETRPASGQARPMIAKGTVLTERHIADLLRAGTREVQVARLDPDDVAEDAAAHRLAQALVSDGDAIRITPPAGGRVNLVADGAGVAVLNVEALHAVNSVSPSITVATVQPFKRMGVGGLIATIKIIPFAVPGDDLAQACAAAQGRALTSDQVADQPAVGLARAKFSSASLIETRVGAEAPSDKGRRALAGRLQPFGMVLKDRCVVPHTEEAVAEALQQARGEVVFILTDTATSDSRDTAPEAVRRAGGALIHYGMPVDPGNLLFLARLDNTPVIGLPGCARSPALNGADWVMERVICGLPVGRDEIMAMGVGGLLKDIPERGRPRR